MDEEAKKALYESLMEYYCKEHLKDDLITFIQAVKESVSQKALEKIYKKHKEINQSLIKERHLKFYRLLEEQCKAALQDQIPGDKKMV
jgi:hypothetical protein